MMKYSIIIPAHNSAKYITKALESVKQQTFKDYELIVIADSCEDSTEPIASMYGARVFVEKFNNDGLSRSKGLDVAQGEYVLFIDDDDWWLHEYVLQMIDDKLQSCGKIVDMLCFGFIWKGIGYASPSSCHGNLYPSVWNKVWRREKIGDTRFPNVYSISDSYFHTDMLMKDPSIVQWDMPLYYYNYLREGSISQKMGRTIENTKRYWREH